jgi:spermidine dehydrogenase
LQRTPDCDDDARDAHDERDRAHAARNSNVVLEQSPPGEEIVPVVRVAQPGLPIGGQGSRGRAQLLGTSFAQYERAFREQLGDMFAPGGFDPRRDIAGIILNRWGHAYVNPQPGFFFGVNGKPASRDVLRGRPHGRIAFANTDLAGASDHRNSIREADRAVGQLLGVLAPAR